MNGRTLMLMLVAIGCGLGAMFGTQRLLNRGEKAEPMREILVAARDLQIEEILSADLIKVQKRAAKSVPAGAFSSFKDVDKRWVKIPILAGEPIIEAKLAPRDTPTGLIPRIEKGKRAFSLEVNEEIGVAGFIQPDHHVDVVLARNNRSNSPGATRSETILQDVPVLASGQATSRLEDNKTAQVRTVTLALTPEEVETVVAARSEGELSLALRGFQDHAVIEKPEPPAEPPLPPAPELLAKPTPAPEPEPAPPPAPPKPSRRTIVVFRGLAATNKRPNPERIAVGPPEEERSFRDLFSFDPFSDPPTPDTPPTPDVNPSAELGFPGVSGG